MIYSFMLYKVLCSYYLHIKGGNNKMYTFDIVVHVVNVCIILLQPFMFLLHC